MRNALNENIIERYCDSIWIEKGLSKNTISSYSLDLNHLNSWLEHNGKNLLVCEESDLNLYLATKFDSGISASSINRSLSSIKGLYNWLMHSGMIKINPTELIESPKIGRKLPTNISEEDIDQLLNAPDCSTKKGKRDKTILEFYHKTYKLSKYKDRDLADIYGIYFDDAIKLKIVNNNEGEDSDKRTIRPGVGCRFSTTNSKLLIPLMKTLKDGKRLLDDGAKQKYKCLVIELFLRFKEYMSQRNGGPLYFYNQGLHGIE